MGVPLRQQWAVGSYLIKQKLKGAEKYPLVLMLEPLFRCNLECAGCGKIDYSDDILDKRLTFEECMEAVDECGAPEFFTGGAKITLLAGENGKLSSNALAAYCGRKSRGVHHMPSAAVTISQATEAGTVYQLDEIAAISLVCRQHGLRLHMDGARFANAVAALSCSPADATWRAGIDIMSFGLTKNGAMVAEAVVIFDPVLAESFGYRRKRAGHLFSKMRFVSAQIEAQLTDGLWLRLAAHANAMAARLTQGLQRLPQISLVYPAESNEVFVELPGAVASGLESQGYRFHRWIDGDRPCIRLVTAFDTEPDHVDGFISAVAVLIGE